jgi:hypothetical protein
MKKSDELLLEELDIIRILKSVRKINKEDE